jgi:peptidyl-prolyl cis-trans isomerase C
MNSIKTHNLFALAFAGALAVLTCNAQAADIIAKVNGEPIPQSRLDYLVKANTAQGHPDTPEARERGRDLLITHETLYQEALKKGYDKIPEVATQIEMMKEEAVVNAYLRDYVKNNPISDERAKQEYERQKTLMGGKEYKARHILVKTEDEAKQIVAELKKGTSFEELAAQKSMDEGSKSNGGDLGWSSPARYVPEFGNALKASRKGEITETPVQTQYGWHVIRVDDERAETFPPFEQVKSQIEQNLQREAVGNMVTELRAKAKIE